MLARLIFRDPLLPLSFLSALQGVHQGRERSSSLHASPSIAVCAPGGSPCSGSKCQKRRGELESQGADLPRDAVSCKGPGILKPTSLSLSTMSVPCRRGDLSMGLGTAHPEEGQPAPGLRQETPWLPEDSLGPRPASAGCSENHQRSCVPPTSLTLEIEHGVF